MCGQNEYNLTLNCVVYIITSVLYRLQKPTLCQLIALSPFKAYWSREAPTGLTFNNCTLCPHCIYVLCIYLKTSSDLYQVGVFI